MRFDTVAAKKAYAALEPSDLLNKHAWLFREGWVEESAEEIEEEEIEVDFRAREERIQKLRVEALREIHNKRGLQGLLNLAGRGKASWQIGWLTAVELLSERELKEFLRLALEPILAGEVEVFPQKNLIVGALRSIGDNDKRGAVIQGVIAKLPEHDAVRMLVLAPFRSATWKLVDALGDKAQSSYWTEIVPDWIHDSVAENTEAVERLLKAERPRAAFHCVQYEPAKLDASLLYRLLSETAQGGNDKPGQYQLEDHSIQQAFKHINDASDLTLEQKAALEFAYIEVLARPWDDGDKYGIPNLERYVELHPETFVQTVVWSYKRDDEGKDPPDLQVAPDNVQNLAKRGFRLLEGMGRIPGHNDLDELEAERLAKWVATVRRSCAELARAKVGDINLGKLLSNAPIGNDGVWPCEPVRKVMEEIQSEELMSGAQTGVYNSRGVVWRGEGGDQERELAAKYRKWGEALQFSHPFVSANLLMALAKTYEHEANREDTEAGIRRRLR